MTRVLVTGGAGAIGSNLVSALLGRGDEVIVLDDLSSGYRANVPADARFVEGSVTDLEAVEACFDLGPRQVFHLAALFANQNSVDHPALDLAVNAGGTVNVLDAAVRTSADKVLVTSSSCIYGSAFLTAEDDVELATDTPYAISKRMTEAYSQFWVRNHGLDVVIVRPFNSYGPNERPGRYRNVIPNFLAAALRGEPLPITGTGEETRDFTFVSDVVSGMVGAMDAQTEPGATFNLASGRETRIAELAELVIRLTGSRAGVVRVPRRGWDATLRRVGDIRRAAAAFGYEPRIALEEGVERTLAWMRRAGA